MSNMIEDELQQFPPLPSCLGSPWLAQGRWHLRVAASGHSVGPEPLCDLGRLQGALAMGQRRHDNVRQKRIVHDGMHSI